MAIFPGAIAGDSDLFIAVNNTATQLNGAHDNSITTITVIDTTAFPAEGYITIGSEAIKYASKNATQFLSVTRGADNTVAQPHASLDVVFHAVIADHHNVLKEEIKAIEADLFNIVKPQQVTNTADIGSLLLNAPQNLLVNGGLEIWQRGTSFNSPVSGAFGPDKWKILKNAAPTFTVDKETGAVNVDNDLSSAKIDVTVVSGSTGVFLRQEIENLNAYVGKTLTVSARIKSSVGGVGIGIFDGATSQVSAAHSGGGAFETISKSTVIVASPALVTVDVGFILGSLTVGTVYIDSVMLSIGSEVMPFQPEDPAKAMERVQRYYEITGSTISAIYPISRQTSGVIVISQDQRFNTRKSVIPTITISNIGIVLSNLPTSGNVGTSGDTGNWNLSASGVSEERFNLSWTRTSDLTTKDIAEVNATWTAEA